MPPLGDVSSHPKNAATDPSAPPPNTRRWSEQAQQWVGQTFFGAC